MEYQQFRQYETELVGEDEGAHKRLSTLLGVSEIGVKRYATDARPIPEYIARSIRAMVLLKRKKILNNLDEMP